MNWPLKTAADYVQTGKVVTGFFSFIRQIKRIITFTQERANRLTRFIEIVRAYKAGKPLRDIETQYGCSRNTILRYARMAGLPKRPKSDDPERHAKIIKLSKEGLSAKHIALACNCSIALVSKVEHAAGIERYKKK